jgi:hypothetical protein
VALKRWDNIRRRLAPVPRSLNLARAAKLFNVPPARQNKIVVTRLDNKRES